MRLEPVISDHGLLSKHLFDKATNEIIVLQRITALPSLSRLMAGGSAQLEPAYSADRGSLHYHEIIKFKEKASIGNRCGNRFSFSPAVEHHLSHGAAPCCGLTVDVSGVRKQARPAGARPLHRKVRSPHANALH